MSENERNSTSNDSEADGVDTAVGKDTDEETAENTEDNTAESGETEEESTADTGSAVSSSVGAAAGSATGSAGGSASGSGKGSVGGSLGGSLGGRQENGSASSGGGTTTKTPPPPQGPNAVKATMSSRKAHLTVSRVEPWSVMKFSFVVSLVCFIILFVAVAVTYATLSVLGVFDELTAMITALLEGDGGEDELGLNPAAWFSPGRVLGYTGVVGALNIVLLTALATVGAMLYNLVADLVGGVDITLSEAE